MSTPELPPGEKLALGLAAATSAEVSDDPDPDTQKENAKAALDRDRYRTETTGRRQNITERKKYAQLFFCLSCAWLVAIVAILMLQGFGSLSFEDAPFKLSDSIVLAMIGSTTANVLGILYVVANYLFPKHGEDDNEMDSTKPPGLT